MIVIKSRQEIDYMRESGKITAEVLIEIEKYIKPGVSTGELNLFAEEYINRKNAIAAFKKVPGYNHGICASINSEVVHGIPDNKRILESGDIIGIDVGVYKNGYYGDAAFTYPVGEISKEAALLIEVTKKSLDIAIEKTIVNNRLFDISNAIESYVKKFGFSPVRDFVGHGIGTKMHEQPQIPNFGEPGTGPRLKAGMVFAIEPMINIGSYEVKVLPDKWTVATKDGSLSCHFEHTVAITEDGPEVLTKFI
ncbi:MAG: type I methionyl aminopeptidase [Candidatus Firestonebacteria bacterium]|nr:type I methionyl aminopeptidase [Candidatus Firestonebacteria bacterium]